MVRSDLQRSWHVFWDIKFVRCFKIQLTSRQFLVANHHSFWSFGRSAYSSASFIMTTPCTLSSYLIWGLLALLLNERLCVRAKQLVSFRVIMFELSSIEAADGSASRFAHVGARPSMKNPDSLASHATALSSNTRFRIASGSAVIDRAMHEFMCLI